MYFPAILKVQSMFPPIFGPDKHTGEVGFCVKTMRKKLIFSCFTYSVKVTSKSFRFYGKCSNILGVKNL